MESEGNGVGLGTAAGRGTEGLEVKPGVRFCLRSSVHHRNKLVKWNREQKDTQLWWEPRGW